ncbi:glycosyltransferase family 2 protein [Candidatus Woesearchaeota archaeon]|nr:glycosyltransferase family 2 protein [Candidatus Woesearchaeota archaeon]
MELSVVIPVYNEKKNIDLLYNKLNSVLSKIRKDYEIIFVDDGSTDNSFELIKRIAKKDKKVKCISFLRNFKKSAAYMAGFNAIKGDIVITMDADLQDDPREIPKFLEGIKKYDLVMGWKFERKDPLHKIIASKIFNFLNYLFFGLKLHDHDSGFKAMKAKVAKSLNIYGDLYRYIPAIVSRDGFSVGETKVKHHERRFGKSKYGSKRIITGALDLLTVKFLTNFNQRPLHLFGGLGMFSFILGFIAELYVLYCNIFLKEAFATHLAMLILGVLLIILGVQLTGIGLIGELVISKKENIQSYKIRETINYSKN